MSSLYTSSFPTLPMGFAGRETTMNFAALATSSGMVFTSGRKFVSAVIG